MVRRTGVGIGGCQGVRCAPRLAQLIGGPRLDALRRSACLLEPARRAALDELAAWLTAAMEFPVGAVLLTGTCLVPPDEFTLETGDVTEVSITGIGTLRNTVERVGAPAPLAR